MGLTPGDRLGPYRIVRMIGAGGMGEVYQTHDTRLNRTVAVKVLAARLADNVDARERFEREALAVSSLNHPHVCVLYDIGWQDSLSYLVMEYLEGESLASYLKRRRLALDETLRYAIDICDALGAAHICGIVHRDIKPANIFLTSRGQIKILDFGLAKLTANSSNEAFVREHMALTVPGAILGTVRYMSPEQASGEELDARSDLFSFGAVLYEMCTGTVAFPGDTAVAFGGILTQPPADPAALNPDLPSDLRHVIDRLLKKDRASRYQSAGDVLL